MSSAWSALRSSAATKHDTEPLLQSTAVANIIFVNIDWKRGRHENPSCTRKNLKILADTTSSIVTNMKPAVICCCEVGTAKHPMTMEEMSAMAQAMREAWEGAATEHPVISFLFEDDAPYLTIWDDSRCNCTHGRILEKVYYVPGHRRTAQAFLCTMPGDTDEEGIDVVNVHAPSGTPKLTDEQRFQLVQNLLQSSSRSKANRSIGESKFLLGGDMNTDEMPLGQILDTLKKQGILKTNVETMMPLDAQHGDICVVGGFTTTIVKERARNHDPKHVPYGIAWRKQAQQATEQLTTTPPPQTQIPTTTPPGTQLSQLAGEKVSASSCSATKHPYEVSETVTPQHQTDAGVIQSCDADTNTTPHATEQSHPDEHEVPELNGPEQKMAYVIVKAFLDKVTFESTDAERLIKRVILKAGEVIQPNMLDNIDEVFRPIFFHYPNGLCDRTRAEPRDPMQYITQWQDIASWRQRADAGATQHATERLTKQQMQSILHKYIDNFIQNEANDTQREQSWNQNKSRAEARLRRLCGSVMMAKIIWQVGLPHISEAGFATKEVLPATEQQQDSIATATETILNWLSMVANLIQEHKATPEYKEHARKSGNQKNKSGLTEIELKMKEEKKRAARLKYGRQHSTASGSDRWQTLAQWQWHDGTLHARTQWQWHHHTWQAPGQWQ